jgi:hypothetical protein
MRLIPASEKIRLYSYQKVFVEQVDTTTTLVPFKINGHHFTAKFWICNELPSGVIIGLDWLAQHGAIIDCRKKMVTFEHGEQQRKPTVPLTASLNQIQSFSPDNEFYTPVSIVELLRRAAGVQRFDLDPASCEEANSANVRAVRFFSMEDKGLELPWNGNVFVNPPYRNSAGSVIGEWIQKAMKEYDAGRSQSVIMLLRSAVNSKHFQPVLDRGTACYLTSRIRFDTPIGPSRWKSRDSHCVWYLGPDPDRFQEVMAGWGLVTNKTSSSVANVNLVSEEQLLEDCDAGAKIQSALSVLFR